MGRTLASVDNVNENKLFKALRSEGLRRDKEKKKTAHHQMCIRDASPRVFDCCEHGVDIEAFHMAEAVEGGGGGLVGKVRDEINWISNLLPTFLH